MTLYFNICTTLGASSNLWTIGRKFFIFRQK